jgi:hypothetical protein
MSFKDEVRGESGIEITDLDSALSEYRLSIHAWSDAAYSTPRTAMATTRQRHFWRCASGLALSCVVIAGGISAVVYQHHQQLPAVAVVQVAKRVPPVVQQQIQPTRQEDEDLLAKVDSDVARGVPSAMEPLAQLMAEDENQ